MGFWKLLEVASAPVVQVLLISALGAFMATGYGNNLLSADFRKSLNKARDLSVKQSNIMNICYNDTNFALS